MFLNGIQRLVHVNHHQKQSHYRSTTGGNNTHPFVSLTLTTLFSRNKLLKSQSFLFSNTLPFPFIPLSLRHHSRTRLLLLKWHGHSCTYSKSKIIYDAYALLSLAFQQELQSRLEFVLVVMFTCKECTLTDGYQDHTLKQQYLSLSLSCSLEILSSEHNVLLLLLLYDK